MHPQPGNWHRAWTGMGIGKWRVRCDAAKPDNTWLSRYLHDCCQLGLVLRHVVSQFCQQHWRQTTVLFHQQLPCAEQPACHESTSTHLAVDYNNAIHAVDPLEWLLLRTHQQTVTMHVMHHPDDGLQGSGILYLLILTLEIYRQHNKNSAMMPLYTDVH